MRLHIWTPAPSPRRVKMFVVEKGIAIPMEEVGAEDLRLRAEYRDQYSFGMVPMLELDDGTQIGEVAAICRYLECVYPDPPLLGSDAREKAIVEMWDRRAYDDGLIGASEVFRNTHPLFKDRGLPGYSEPVEQIPALITRGRQRLTKFFHMFDRQLMEKPFVAGNRISLADLTTFCSIDFAKMSEIDIPAQCIHLRRWYAMMSERPSANV